MKNRNYFDKEKHKNHQEYSKENAESHDFEDESLLSQEQITDNEENFCDCTNDCNCHKDEYSNCGEKCNCNDECDCDCKGDGEKCNCNDECNCESKDNENSEKSDNLEGSSSEVENHSKENQDYFNILLQTKAEFDNYRKRTANIRLEAFQDGFMEAVREFLPALDSFILAQDMIKDKNTLMGIKFIEKGILDTLAKMGVEKISCDGEFNPELHSCIDTVSEGDVPSNHIVKVATNGFTYKGKVLRYANVIIKK